MGLSIRTIWERCLKAPGSVNLTPVCILFPELHSWPMLLPSDPKSRHDCSKELQAVTTFMSYMF